jgi:lipoprotein NlpI
MSRRGGKLLVIAVALLAMAAPAKADGWADATLCQREVFGDRDLVFDDIDGDIEVAIHFCTRAIESGDLSRPFLARTLRNRAIVFSFAGYLRRALADFDDSFALNPADAKTLTYRGLAVQQAGDVFAAQSFFLGALNIDPNETLAQILLDHWISFWPPPIVSSTRYPTLLDLAGPSDPRALEILRERQSDHQRALLLHLRAPEIDFLLRIHLRLKSPYAALWLYLGGEKDGIDVRQRLREYAEQRGVDDWPNPLLRLYLGEIDFAAAARAAGDTVSTWKKRKRLCDLRFYHAELLWVRDMASQELSYQTAQELHKVADHCPRQSRESGTARAHLNWWAQWTDLSQTRRGAE